MKNLRPETGGGRCRPLARVLGSGSEVLFQPMIPLSPRPWIACLSRRSARFLALGCGLVLASLGGARTVRGAEPFQSVFCRFDLTKDRTSEAPAFPPGAVHCTCLEDVAYFVNSDQQYDQAVMWKGAALGPDSGMFAEYYETPENRAGALCQLVLRLTDAGAGTRTTLDILVWDDDGGLPGEMLGVLPAVNILSVPPLPAVGTKTIEIYERVRIGVQGGFWVGIRGNWDAEDCTFLLPVDTVDDDLENPAFLRRGATYVGPGADELSPGWHLLEELLGVPAATGINAVVGWCPVPVLESSWGQIKLLYGDDH